MSLSRQLADRSALCPQTSVLWLLQQWRKCARPGISKRVRIRPLKKPFTACQVRRIQRRLKKRRRFRAQTPLRQVMAFIFLVKTIRKRRTEKQIMFLNDFHSPLLIYVPFPDNSENQGTKLKCYRNYIPKYKDKDIKKSFMVLKVFFNFLI